MRRSVALSIFTLCDHHHHPHTEVFILQNWSAAPSEHQLPIPLSRQPLANTILHHERFWDLRQPARRSVSACLGIWCQGVKVRRGFCQNLNRQDCVMGFRNGPFSPDPGRAALPLEAPRGTGKTLERRDRRLQAPGSRLHAPGIAEDFHVPPRSCLHEWARASALTVFPKTVRSKSSNQCRWLGVWMTPFPRPCTFSNFRPWVQSQGGCVLKITEVRFSVSGIGWRLGDKINLGTI